MKTVGELLQSARIKHGLTVDEISKITHIRTKYLHYLENNEYEKLPSSVYVRGFIKNYAESLSLSSDTFLAVFRRDFAENEKGEIVPRTLLGSIESPPWWYSRVILATFTAFTITIFSMFVLWQYTSLIRPKLIVIEPLNNQVIDGPTISVKGITDPTAVVTINGQLVNVSSNGDFEIRVPVTGNQMSLTITATNRRNNSTQIQRNVITRPSVVPSLSP